MSGWMPPTSSEPRLECRFRNAAENYRLGATSHFKHSITHEVGAVKIFSFPRVCYLQGHIYPWQLLAFLERLSDDWSGKEPQFLHPPRHSYLNPAVACRGPGRLPGTAVEYAP